MGSGSATLDAECGFTMANPKQAAILGQNMLAKIGEIEEQVALTGGAIVACSHGSNRSFLIANMYHQKQHAVSYETVRHLMCQHRGVQDGPLVCASSVHEPPEFLKGDCCHRTRPRVPVSTRKNHTKRWGIRGVEYTALLVYENTRTSVSDTDTEDEQEEEGEGEVNPPVRPPEEAGEANPPARPPEAEHHGLK
jgi:hypothetical protein